MFTGIVETLGKVAQVDSQGGNRVFTLSSTITSELKVDQSVSHNGVCLTVSALISPDHYQVVAVPETLKRSNLATLAVGDLVNLERSMIFGGRVDGHLVQGHVDQMAICKSIKELDGSWEYVFENENEPTHVLIEKGSVCVNGVSLTCYNIGSTLFQVSIIPYTYENTNFRLLEPGTAVNLEFDVIGKYVQAMISRQGTNK